MDAAHLSVKAKDKASVGYEVVTAINRGDAKAILERRTDIDILFTDVVMPKGIRGLQLAYLARKRVKLTISFMSNVVPKGLVNTVGFSPTNPDL